MKRMILLLVACLVLTMTGCNQTKDDIGYAVADAAALMETDGVFTGTMEEVDPETAAMIYGIDYASVTEAVCYMAINSSVSADEVSVWVMKDESSAQSAEAACLARMERQLNGYKTYCPDQVPKLEKAIVSRMGVTVLLAAGEPESLSQALETLN